MNVPSLNTNEFSATACNDFNDRNYFNERKRPFKNILIYQQFKKKKLGLKYQERDPSLYNSVHHLGYDLHRAKIVCLFRNICL